MVWKLCFSSEVYIKYIQLSHYVTLIICYSDRKRFTFREKQMATKGKEETRKEVLRNKKYVKRFEKRCENSWKFISYIFIGNCHFLILFYQFAMCVLQPRSSIKIRNKCNDWIIFHQKSLFSIWLFICYFAPDIVISWRHFVTCVFDFNRRKNVWRVFMHNSNILQICCFHFYPSIDIDILAISYLKDFISLVDSCLFYRKKYGRSSPTRKIQHA